MFKSIKYSISSDKVLREFLRPKRLYIFHPHGNLDPFHLEAAERMLYRITWRGKKKKKQTKEKSGPPLVSEATSLPSMQKSVMV